MMTSRGLVEKAATAATLMASETEEAVQERRQPVGPINGHFWGTGRRKTSTARVRIREGSGLFLVNDREVPDYFPDIRWQHQVYEPLRTSGLEGKVDVFVSVQGGGLTGQAGAIVMGLARAIRNMRPELEPLLREHGYLTRDARMVERKKYGHKKARRSFQFSKR
jgi:small subunit ribosomal protein S9